MRSWDKMVSVGLDTELITDWDSFHEECRKIFGFPDFYGENMDAWIDCMSDLREGGDMTHIRLAPDEMLFIEILATEAFKKRLPDILDELVECTAFVNQRCLERGESPALSLVFL